MAKKKKILELRLYSTYCKENSEKLPYDVYQKVLSSQGAKHYTSAKYLGIFQSQVFLSSLT